MVRVTAVVVSFNTVDLIADAIESLLGEVNDDIAVDVIVVDNASTDGSAAHLRSRYATDARVRVAESKSNLGFARAVNDGSQDADGDLLLLFNPDARLAPGGLAELIRARDHNEAAGMYGPAVLFPDGRVNPTTARAFPTLWSMACHALMLSYLFPDVAAFNTERYPRWDRRSKLHVEILSGVCLLIDRRLWDRLGGFDDRFWLYGEDADLCRRAADAGASPVVVPEAVVVHAPGSSSSDSARKLAWMRCGEVTYLRRHWKGMRLVAGLTLLWCGSAIRAARHVVRPRPADTDWVALFRLRESWLAGYGPGPHDGPPF